MFGSGSSNSGWLLKSALLIAGVTSTVFILTDGNRATGQIARAPSPPDPAPKNPVELATYMGELQRLTHKLSLAVKNENYRLASFYLYESLESLEDIKTEVPEYRGLPIALLIDQLNTKRYQELEQALKQDETEGKLKRSPAAVTALVNSCNQCHVATRHEFIKITDRGDFNPFNQDFKPRAPVPHSK